jgi:hypothetical protein
MALYEVNYVISNAFTTYVEATSPENARTIIETIYQENWDALPEDGELDHEIFPGTLVEGKLLDLIEDSEIRVLADAFPRGIPADYNEEDYS